MGWQTVDTILSRVQEPKYASFLVQNILSTSNGIFYDCNNDIQLDLILLGVLAIKGVMIDVSSPLMRTILLNGIPSTKKCTVESIHMTSAGLLDVPALVRCVME